MLNRADPRDSEPCSKVRLEILVLGWCRKRFSAGIGAIRLKPVPALFEEAMKRFRVKKAEPGLVRVEYRLLRSEKAALASRAETAGVSVAEFLREMTRIELHDDNPYTAAAYLRLRAVEARELERRDRVRA